jgi:hypothetical protein
LYRNVSSAAVFTALQPVDIGTSELLNIFLFYLNVMSGLLHGMGPFVVIFIIIIITAIN